MSPLGKPLPPAASDSGRAWQPRDVQELFRLRGNLLTGEDRALIGMYLEGGETVRRIATLADVNPSSVARRIHTITQRLADPTYPVCLAHRRDFSSLELRVIRDYFVRGLSMAKIERRRHLSKHRIRAALRKARHCTSAEATARQKG